MGRTEISWATYSFNPWWGCYHAGSPACDNCYARGVAARFHPAEVEWVRLGNRRAASESYWQKPLRWNEAAKKAGKPARVFCMSMGDFFELSPPLWGPRARTVELMEKTPYLQWLVLTKRPENYPDCNMRNGFPDNVAVGVTVEDQERADERIPQLLEIPAAMRFLSCEPLLGPVDLREVICLDGDRLGPALYNLGLDVGIDWIITGGESGPGARPSHPVWFRSLRVQCEVADVPFFFKQWGAWAPERLVCERDQDECWGRGQAGIFDRSHGWTTDTTLFACNRGPRLFRVGKKAAGRELDGRTWDQSPEDRNGQ